VKGGSAGTVYDAIVVPALCYAERDRIEGRLSIDEEQAIVEASRDLLEDGVGLLDGVPPPKDRNPAMRAPGGVGVLGWPAHGAPDVLALRMLGDLLKDRPITLETLPSPALFADG